MTNYPSGIDDDLTISRIEDNITEIGGEVINALRDAVITIQYTLGINPQGTVNDLVTRLAVSLNDDGTLKSSALSVPSITNSMVAAGAGIVESKLSLDVSTATLNANIQAASLTIDTITNVLNLSVAQFSEHLYGLSSTVDGYFNRHVASHVDINNGLSNGYTALTGIDPRDPSFYNAGLYNTNGTVRVSTNLMSALIEINNDLINHLLSISNPHSASFITLDTSDFIKIPPVNNTVQLALEYLDRLEESVFQENRGIPRSSMVLASTTDAYNTYYGPYVCSTTNTSYNYSKVVFTAGQTNLDWSFKDLVPGDLITINYGGFSSSFEIDSINYTAGATYEIVINGIHPAQIVGATALLEKSHYDENKYGVLAVAPANHNFNSGANSANVPGSAIIVAPNCPQATGFDLALDELDSTHYMLYLGYYPTGNPAEINLKFNTINGVDVTGNFGATPGQYTLQDVIIATNKGFRNGGVNLRFAAFEYKGQFGIALCDTISNPGFSIISGTTVGTTLTEGIFVNNVVGDARTPLKDPLGLGALKANLASPEYTSVTTTNTPTKVFLAKQSKNYILNGQYRDYLSDGYTTAVNGFYSAILRDTSPLGTTRTQGIYRVSADLSALKLYKGSTILVMPESTPASAADYLNYGRFIVEDLTYSTCPGSEYTDITVITCTSSGDPTDAPTTPLPVRIYFSDDTVSFNVESSSNYRRLCEVFINSTGDTFSHIRTQFELVTGSSTLLQTDLGTTDLDTNYGWHVVDISPKFRGFVPIGSSTLDKYIRFFITNYNSTDDSFDGYIGQGSGSISINNGAVVKSRKGQVTRFYDYTGVDYIDILFQDNISSPLTIVCPAGQSRYVDIRIFDTMRTNESYMCLATCEQFIKGGPKATLWYFQDKREFGTVSEKALTTSALSYIESSDRLSKKNGISYGFEYISATTTSITLNGGTALINGTIVNKNNFTVHSYPLYVSPGVTPTTVNFAVCLTQDNSYELIPIGDTSSTITYNVGSVYVHTLSQILENRKDLLPIYILPVTSTSTTSTIGTPLDIRFFINNSESKAPLEVCGNTNGDTTNSIYLGSFATLQAAANYIIYSNNIHSTIKIKGTITLDQNVSFSGKSVSIIGEKSNQVNCTTSSSMIALSSNMEIIGVNFVRQYGTDVSATAYSTAGYGLATIGLVMATGALSYENITIKDCTFSTAATYRKSSAAHILFEQTGDGAILSNINIINNRFKETTAQLCIAFVNKTGGSIVSTPTLKGTILNDVTIEGNKGNFNSYIILSSDNYTGGSGRSSRGLSAYNLKISKNTFDYVWLNLSRSVLDSYNLAAFTVYSASYPQFRPCVVISENSFNGITSKAIDGTLIYDTYTVKAPTPATIVCNNVLSNATLMSNADIVYAVNSTAQGELIVSNNIFNPSIYNVSAFTPSDTPIATSSIALEVVTNLYLQTVTSLKNVVNINNNIFQNKIKDYTSTTGYISAITCYAPANINNNIISNCLLATGSGIELYCYIEGSSVHEAQITNNSITRGSASINQYILIAHYTSTESLKSIIVTDNYFDSQTVDGSITNLVSYDAITPQYYNLLFQRNKNARFTVDLMDYIEDTYTAFVDSTEISGWCKYSYTTASPATTKKWIVPSCASKLSTNGTYSVSPLIINIPTMDGATLSSISMKVTAKVSTNPNVVVSVATQDSTINNTATLSSLSTTQYTVTTSPAIFYADGVSTTVTIDMTSLPARYALVSNSRSLPVYILFCVAGNLYSFSKTTPYYTSTEYINITELKGTFIY